MLTLSTEIPYFGEHTQITLICDSCGWKHTDFIPSEGLKPGAWTLALDSEEKLSARVVRSSSCTIRITELDLEVSPGSSSSGFISNVEGVIKRFEDAIGIVLKGSDSEIDDVMDSANDLLEKLERVKSGDSSSKIELLDPRGRSQILHENAISRDLTEDESATLQVGYELPYME
tara:strand:- start:229 stop:750 length:522 start_codon:yes stop_codon:yes gene_type:complete